MTVVAGSLGEEGGGGGFLAHVGRTHYVRNGEGERRSRGGLSAMREEG